MGRYVCRNGMHTNAHSVLSSSETFFRRVQFVASRKVESAFLKLVHGYGVWRSFASLKDLLEAWSGMRPPIRVRYISITQECIHASVRRMALLQHHLMRLKPRRLRMHDRLDSCCNSKWKKHHAGLYQRSVQHWHIKLSTRPRLPAPLSFSPALPLRRIIPGWPSQ